MHDRLIGAELLQEARADAELIDAGKGPGTRRTRQEEINALLVDRARLGRTVVRLKGGDPFVFGRGSEEAAACREAGVPVYVVPGVTQRDRRAGRGGHSGDGARAGAIVRGGHGAPGRRRTARRPTFAALAGVDTLVVLMGRAGLGAFTAQLIAAGRDPATPAACIQSATTPEQRVTRATLATIADAADRDGLENPVVTVIGAVAALADAELDAVADQQRWRGLAVGAGA